MYKNNDYSIEIGDFPEEDLYKLFYKDQQIDTFNKWPKNWIAPGSEKKPHNDPKLTPKS